MRIIIDARLWSESGIGRYVRNLIEGLQRADHQNEYYVLHLQDDFDKLVYRAENFHKILADFRWYTFSEQIKLPKIINSLKPDLIHFPHFNVPIFYKGKFVVTIHDLIHQHFQTRDASTHGPIIHTIKKIGYRKTFSHAVSGSSKIITPSNFVKEQLVNEWNVPEGKITITYEAVEDNFLRLAQKANGKITVKKPYLFYVGNAQPHKNLLILIKVFKKLKEKYQDLSLVLSGPPHKFWEDIKAVSHIGGVI
ncbi:MAG: glycosyl transferase, group 1, partial [Parcubacteria group bacterium GW2011_GWC1_38_6]